MARRVALSAALLSLALCCARAQSGAEGAEAAASAAASGAAPPPQPLHLLALSTVLHAAAPPGALGGRALERDATVYLRCYSTNVSASAGGWPADAAAPQGVPLAAAVNADRRQGLHAALPVEHVSSGADPSSGGGDNIGRDPSAVTGLSGTAQPNTADADVAAQDGHNVYHVGDWAALGGSDLWCELYDIGRAAAGADAALGGALLRARDFGYAGDDQLPVAFVAAAGGAVTHAATVTFRCPLCALAGGQSSVPGAFGASLGANTAAAVDAFVTLFPRGGDVAASSSAGIEAQADAPLKAPRQQREQQKAAEPNNNQNADAADVAVLAELAEAISHATAAWAAHGGDATSADGGPGGWLSGLIAAASEAHAALLRNATWATQEPSATSAAPFVAGGALSPAELAATEAEAAAAVAEAFAAAARRGGDPAVAVRALAAVTARLAERYAVPVRVQQLDAVPLHVRQAAQAAPTERWGDPQPRRVRIWAIVLVTLAAAAGAAAAAAAGLALWRRSRGGGAAGGAAPAKKLKLKRKNSDFCPDTVPQPRGSGNAGGGNTKAGGFPAAALAFATTTGGGGAGMMCEVQLGTPGGTPRSNGATPRSGRREAHGGAGAA